MARTAATAAGAGEEDPADSLAQEVGGPRAVFARPSRRRAISTSPVLAATASSGY